MNWIPRFLLNLNGAENCPGVPLVSLGDLIDTLARLIGRDLQVETAKKGLTNKYMIGSVTATALEFMYGRQASASPFLQLKLRLETDGAGVLRLLREDAGDEKNLPAAMAATDPLTKLSLTTAEQWGMGWTTYAGVYERAQKQLGEFTAALDPSKPAEASARFWPTIATYGLPYNLLILQKVKEGELTELKNLFGSAWQADWDAAAASGDLFMIDLRILQKLPVDKENRRFTPASVTLLRRTATPQTWRMLPVAVRVSGQGGADAQVYVESSPAWLYGLQAARTSVTVYGIWLGHVYQWHMVTAAMFQSMNETVPAGHAVRQLLDPQAKYLFAFDEVLLLGWSGIAPPSSVSTPFEFLRLLSDFARDVHMDDPTVTIARNGLEPDDFRVNTPWDQFPIVQTFLSVWDATKAYIDIFVQQTYPSGNSPSHDAALQHWMKQAAASDAGNVKGLPSAINTDAELRQLLTSLLYRVTMHGSARLLSIANPGLAFVANYPPCLQYPADQESPQIPPPDTHLTAESLFAHLPVTGVIGLMLTFYNTFAFSRPYEPFVPAYGVDSNLFFPGGLDDPRNQALVRYRLHIESLIEQLSPNPTPTQPQRYQWPLSIET